MSGKWDRRQQRRLAEQFARGVVRLPTPSRLVEELRAYKAPPLPGKSLPAMLRDELDDIDARWRELFERADTEREALFIGIDPGRASFGVVWFRSVTRADGTLEVQVLDPTEVYVDPDASG